MPFPRPSSPSRSSPTPIVVPASLSVVPACPSPSFPRRREPRGGAVGTRHSPPPPPSSPHSRPPSVMPFPPFVVPAEAGTSGAGRHARCRSLRHARAARPPFRQGRAGTVGPRHSTPPLPSFPTQPTPSVACPWPWPSFPTPSPSFRREEERPTSRGGVRHARAAVPSCPFDPFDHWERASRGSGPVGPPFRHCEGTVAICSYKSDHQGFPSSINLTCHEPVPLLQRLLSTSSLRGNRSNLAVAR